MSTALDLLQGAVPWVLAGLALAFACSVGVGRRRTADLMAKADFALMRGIDLEAPGDRGVDGSRGVEFHEDELTGPPRDPDGALRRTTKDATPGGLLDALLDDLRPNERLVVRARTTDIRQLRVEIWDAGPVDDALAISFHVERDVTDVWDLRASADFIAEELFDTLRRGAP